MSNAGKLIAISAPSGAGKSTICKALLAKHRNMRVSISATSRKARGNEQDKIHYFFLSKEEFESKIKIGDFLEYEIVHGEYYGTLKSEVLQSIENGIHVLLDIDVNGALNIKKNYPNCILIFVNAPNYRTLVDRLRGRETETEDQIQRRLERVNYEISKSNEFDYQVVNDDLDRSVQEIEKIIFN